ncbi:MAG TPA: nucleoside/nucleotide kinase family protein [Gaiellaceae bacterium]
MGRIEQRIGSEADAIVRSLAGDLLAAVDAARGRFLLGIAGPPGAGKSTLAGALAGAVGDQRGDGIAVVAPLDGFHLSNEMLDRLGLRSVKGAPRTFDAAAFVAALRSVREEPAATVLWPDFDRVAEATVPDAIPIGPDARLVITEGNYLLLDQPGWREVRQLLDEVWYIDAPRDVLRRRLIERQVAGGRPEQDAVRHVDESDLPNAELVARTRQLADRVIRP